MNFEKAAHNAFKEVFKNSERRGCRFHLSQVWCRNIQFDAFLRQDYKKQEECYRKMIEMFFGLPFLPSDETSDGFLDLQADVPEECTNHTVFSDIMYSRHTYIDETTAAFPFRCELKLHQTYPEQETRVRLSIAISTRLFIRHIHRYSDWLKPY